MTWQGFMSWKRFNLDAVKPNLKPVLTSIKYDFTSEKWIDQKDGRFFSASDWAIPSLFPNIDKTLTFSLRDNKQYFDYNSYENIEHFFFCFNNSEPASTGVYGHGTLAQANQKCEHSKILSILNDRQIQSVTQDLIYDWEKLQFRDFWTDAEILNETHYMIDSKPLSTKILFGWDRPFKGYVSMDENK